MLYRSASLRPTRRLTQPSLLQRSVLQDYFGWGDKETFYYAFLAAHEPAFYNPAPVGSVGLVRPFCRRYKSRQACRDMFTGNTMVQYGLGGNGTAPAPLFLHSNLNKWTLHQPDNFERHYTRRWRVLQPEGEDFPAWSQRMLGVDLERFAYDAVRGAGREGCAPVLQLQGTTPCTSCR